MPAYLPQQTPVNPNRQAYGALTLKEVFRHVLTDLDKDKATNFRVPEFNIYFRKGVNSWKAKLAAAYDSTQQTQDDMRPLSATKIFTPTSTPPLVLATRTFDLPVGYDSTDSLIVNFKVLNSFLAYRTGEEFFHAAKRLTADMEAMIIDDYHQRPSYQRPFYWVRNGYMELQTGLHDNLAITSVVLNYRVNAANLVLTDAMVADDTTDTSPVLEYTSDACDAIVKEIVLLYMERNTDQRVSSYPQVAGVMPAPPRDMPMNSQPMAVPAGSGRGQA